MVRILTLSTLGWDLPSNGDVNSINIGLALIIPLLLTKPQSNRPHDLSITTGCTEAINAASGSGLDVFEAISAG